MPTKQYVHTFNGGMNFDMHPSAVKQNQSSKIMNMRAVATDSSTTTALESINGNMKAYGSTDVITVSDTGTSVFTGDYIVYEGTISDGSASYDKYDLISLSSTTTLTGPGIIVNATTMFPEGVKMCGASVIDNYIYFFATQRESIFDPNVSYILRGEYSDRGYISNVTILYDDSKNIDGSKLGFMSTRRIKSVIVKEREDIIKLYWVDSGSPVRYAIVSSPMTVNGEEFDEVNNKYFGVDRFEFLPFYSPVVPEISELVSGNINTGMIKYTYQLYINYGAETAYSPATNFISVTSANDKKSNDAGFITGDVDVNSGKGFKIKIDNVTPGFSKARLVALEYSRFGEIRNIRIADEVDIDTDGTPFYFTDTGESLYEFTAEEFSVVGSKIFEAKDVAAKDDHLVAGNIKEDYFDIPDDYDTRAYRFIEEGTHNNARVLNSDGSYYRIYAAGAIKYYSGDTVLNDGEWEYYASDDTYLGGGGQSVWDINTNADCINTYNDLDRDTQTNNEYIFTSDYNYLGATGKNIELKIYNDYNLYINETADTETDVIYTQDNGQLNSYSGYSNPYNVEKYRSLQWGEVYRIGIQFFDNRGRPSFVHWVTDMRMPNQSYYNGSAHPYLITVSNGATYEVQVMPLYLSVNLKSMPTGATSYRLMVVPRKDGDKNILATGVLLPVRVDGSDNNIVKPQVLFTGTNEDEQVSIVSVDNGLVRFVSPEVVFNEGIDFRSSDRLRFLGTNSEYYQTGRNSSDPVVVKRIGAFNSLVPDEHDINTFSDIVDSQLVSPQVYDEEPYVINSTSYRSYSNSGNAASHGGTSMILALSNFSFSGYTTGTPLVYYERNLFGSQYGGNTYESRSYNSYVPIGNLLTGVGSDIVVYGGDVYTTMFDYASLLWDLENSADRPDLSQLDVIYFPTVSTINCDLRNSYSYSDYKYTDSSTNSIQLLQEYAGKHVTPYDHFFIQENPLYVYNNVYSQFDSIPSYPAKPRDFLDETNFSSRILYSEKKTYGELNDSWTMFKENNFMDLNSTYEDITSLYVFDNRLMFFQKNAFGIVTTSERALIQDNNPGVLALGNSSWFSRYDYISNEVGNLNPFSVISSQTTLYFFYPYDKSIYSFRFVIPTVKSGGGPSYSPISKSKSIQTWLNSNYDYTYDDELILAYDNINSEIYFSFNKTKDGYTLVYNEMIQAFSSFYSFEPKNYIQLTNDLLLSTEDNVFMFVHNNNVHDFDVLTHTNKFYDIEMESPGVSFIVNADYLYTKTFDSIHWYSDAYKEGAIEEDGTYFYSRYINDYYTTFNKLRVSNDFQNTDWVDLVEGENLVRRESDWSTVVPRDAVSRNISDGEDIMNPINTDKSRLFKTRIRGNYCMVELKLDDILSSGITKIVLPYIKVNYRISIR